MVDIDRSQDPDIYQRDNVLKVRVLSQLFELPQQYHKPLQSAADLAPEPAVTPNLPAIVGHLEHCC